MFVYFIDIYLTENRGPGPRLSALGIPSLSREPSQAYVTACDGLGYFRLGSAGFRLWA